MHITFLMWLSVFAVSCGNSDGRDAGRTSPELSAIDSLMWQWPDSALSVLTEYNGDTEGFNGHYFQLLTSELLFKNECEQSNRTDLVAAMNYFDSLMLVSKQNATIVFLDARAHYMNGVGYYENDSLPEACGEYLHTLRIMQNRFSKNELVGRRARFMALTHNRLMELFSRQFMQEPAIYCGKRSLAYDSIACTDSFSMAKTFLILGKQYFKLYEYDSATYYFGRALDRISDKNTMLYRDWVSLTALQHYSAHHDAVASLDSLRRMVAQASSEKERFNRCLTIGAIYNDLEQYDSAKYYWEPVFEYEKDAVSLRIVANYLREIALKEGDTMKANQYAQVLAEVTASPPESQARVSLLTEMFQEYLREKQEAASFRERKKALRVTCVVLVVLALALVAVTIVIRRGNKERMAAQEAEAQRRLSEASQQREEVERELQTKVEQAVQHTREMLPQRVADLYYSKVPNRMERIMAEFEAAYPHVMEQLSISHPELSETERQIALLNFLHFRAKEEADLLGFTENTMMKYRSNLNKKAGSDPISALLAERKN